MKTTMKQHSFTSQLKSLAVVLGIALVFTSCANEDVAQNPTNPNEDNDKNLTTFVAGDEAKTRTSLDYNSSDFYWEAGDYIYVKDDDGTLQKSSNAPTSKVTSFKYKVPGKFTASTSYKVYYLGKNSNATDKKVTISTAQTQTKPDNTEHFGESGDYGTATATGTLGGGSFSFQLEHQPAYLVFQPYTSNTILHNCYLTGVEVTSDNDITETYTVNTSTGAITGSAGGKKIVLTTKDPTTGSANENGFPLTNSSASVTTNGAYMVIKPGTHTLKVRYWIKDLVTQVEGTITKTLPSTVYASNTYYDMKANLNVRDYDGDHYYMWDAQNQYWYGYEWTKHLSGNTGQPTVNSGSSPNSPQSNSDPNHRYYHEGTGALQASNSCATLPNANEMTWYAKFGDPRWDADELWTTMGHLYKGGMWFKKKSVLQTEGHYNSSISVNGNDWRTDTNGNYDMWPAFNTLPSAADAGNYFYLPALGAYNTGTTGKLSNVGDSGSYWSSSADPAPSFSSADFSFCMYFNSGRVFVVRSNRNFGFRVGGFE
nr:hypothetical protein [uncultured Prevotella sp.]